MLFYGGNTMQKIKWGVLGTAGIAKGCTIPGMQQAENCELYAIAGRDMVKAQAFKEEFGFTVAYDSYEALLKDKEVEAIYIPLPNTLHHEWTIKALQHKKHVLCEKPIAENAKQAEEMYEAAEANGVILMEAFAYQHSPYIAALKEEVDSGVIGDVLYMDSAFLTSDYDLSNIRMRKETLGGCTYDLGVYCTSLIQRIFGEEPKDIKAVASFSPEGVDVLTSVVMEYEDGKKATFNCGMLLATNQDKRIDRFEIHGTKGCIKSGVFEFNLEGNLSYTVETFDGKKEVKTVETPQNYRLEVEQLGRCITDGEAKGVSTDFSMMNARTIDRILKSINY